MWLHNAADSNPRHARYPRRRPSHKAGEQQPAARRDPLQHQAEHSPVGDPDEARPATRRTSAALERRTYGQIGGAIAVQVAGSQLLTE